jgi:hypothetical protein
MVKKPIIKIQIQTAHDDMVDSPLLTTTGSEGLVPGRTTDAEITGDDSSFDRAPPCFVTTLTGDAEGGRVDDLGQKGIYIFKRRVRSRAQHRRYIPEPTFILGSGLMRNDRIHLIFLVLTLIA